MRTTDPATPRKSGLTATGQTPVSPAAVVDLEREDATATAIWSDLFASADVREAFIRAVRDLATDRTATDLLDELQERGVPRHLRGKILAVARGDRRRAWHLAADAVPGLAGGRSTLEDLLATASLFDATPEPPVLAVRMGPAFRERRREQREAVLELLARLARGFDVRLVATRLTRAWLAREHREDLPGVSDLRNAHRDASPVADRVDEALATLDADGGEASLLETLADEPGETLTYRELYAAAHVGKSRVRQRVARLDDLGLVATFGPPSDRQVELLEAGREFLAERDRQITLPDAVSETGQYSPQAVSHANGTAPPDGDAPEEPPYRTRRLGLPRHHAAAATAPEGGLGLVSDTLDDQNPRTRYVSYDPDRNEAVLSVRATGALQYVVSVATALASPRLFDEALPVDRLEAIDDPPAILRDARCIGGYSAEAVEDGQVLRDNLVEWGEEIADLTTDLKRGEYDDRDRLRSAIMRSAHGLAGSIVHLLDAAGVDLTREVRVPDGLDADHLDELARSVGISAAIQSQYGAFAVYRQLFESRENKRQSALTPEVDATDPLGRLIGSLTVRGPDVHRLRPALEEHVGSPRDRVEDAPDLAVHVPIREVDRPAYAETVTRVLDDKNLRPTRDVVAVCQALAGSPHAAADALFQLSPEDREREVRPDEVRFALATLDTDRVLPDLAPTAGKIASTLLTAEEPLPQAALADRADVSTRSVRRHTDRLEALGLVETTGTGYRLALSFRTTEERRRPVTPDTPDRFVDAVARLLEVALPPDRYADPEDPVAGALFYPPDPWGIAAADPTLEPWVSLAAALTATERPGREQTITVGTEPDQTALIDAGGSRDAPMST
jgi:DNA-binding MarR family transcriptional regulator